MKKNMGGITLVALVITIIILIILAGVSINLVLGENGILEKAKEGKEKHSKADAREKLEIVLLDLQADKVIDINYNEETYIDERLNENNIEVEGDIAIVYGWQFEIDRSVPKIGKEYGKLTEEEMLKPIIISFKTIIEETQINVKIKLRNEEGRNIIYTINEIKENEEKINIETSNSIQELEYTFKNLKKGCKYEIKVQASNKYGTDNKEKIVETQAPILISKIIFDKEEQNILIKNKGTKLNYRIEPENATNKEIIWTTSASTIANVENGVITPIKSGSCIITARALEGGVSATCKINVVNGISTIEELVAVNNDLSGNYLLLNDIDLLGIDWTPISTNNHNQNFEGIFDGQGYSIKNLNKPLFKAVGKENSDVTVIKNLELENVSINLPNEYEVGALASNSFYGVNISNIKVTGNIVGKDYVAGILGNIALTEPPPVITNCYVRANITSNGNNATGGIAITSGGKGNISNCYFSGKINGSAEPIALILYMCGIGISNCYYDATNIGEGKNNATGLKTSEFGNSNNFKNWDFENTWVIKDGFPELIILDTH